MVLDKIDLQRSVMPVRENHWSEVPVEEWWYWMLVWASLQYWPVLECELVVDLGWSWEQVMVHLLVEQKGEHFL